MLIYYINKNYQAKLIDMLTYFINKDYQNELLN
jgi:hypothetical protein